MKISTSNFVRTAMGKETHMMRTWPWFATIKGMAPTFRRTTAAMMRPISCGLSSNAIVMAPPTSLTVDIVSKESITGLQGNMYIQRDSVTIGHQAMRGRYAQLRATSHIARGTIGT